MAKRTPLYEAHNKLCAQIVEFAGWEMPLYYTGVIEEHLAARQKAVLFDTSHMGQITVSGKTAFESLQRIITNDLRNLPEGKGFYTVMCHENGGTVDDLFVFNLGNSSFLLVVNAGTSDKDLEWLRKHAGKDTLVKNISAESAKIDIQGPRSEQILQKICLADLKTLKRFYFIKAKLNIKKTRIDAIVSRTGYTGEDGFELYFSKKSAELVWNSLLDSGKNEGILPAGLGARDSLRLEACYSLYGHEITDSITPVEADLAWLVKIEKGDFIGRSALKEQKEKGTERKIAAFELLGQAIPRTGCKVVKDGREIGYVTSGGYSPTLKKPIGLAMIKTGNADAGNHVDIVIREKRMNAGIVKKPFYEYKGGV